MNGYNICKVAGSTLGHKHTEEHKLKLSKMNSGSNNYNYGNRYNLSDEAKEKISKASRGENNPSSKLTRKLVKEIREKYIPRIFSMGKLAREYNVSVSCIKHIIKNRTWRDER